MTQAEMRDASDELRGLHSGIPPCCRDWFSRVWVPYLYGGFHRTPFWWYNGWEYVGCPGCRQTDAKIKLIVWEKK